jgi:hypothetical protein
MIAGLPRAALAALVAATMPGGYAQAPPAPQPAWTPPPPLGTVAGPEADVAGNLRGRIVGVEGGDLVVYEPGGSRLLLYPRMSPCRVAAAAGPDRAGRISYVEECRTLGRYAFRTIGIDGGGDRAVLERNGEVPWILAMLALAPIGGTLAWLQPAGQDQALLSLLDTASGAMRDLGTVSAADMAWFPDGRHLLLTDGGNAGRGSPDRAAPARVRVLDVTTGDVRPIDVGRPANLVFPDGRRILLGAARRRPPPGAGAAGAPIRYAVMDLESGEIREASCPGAWGGPIGAVDADRIVYWGLPTRDLAPGRGDAVASALVDKTQTGTLKVCELETGRFKTVLFGVDPMSAYSFGNVDGPAPVQPALASKIQDGRAIGSITADGVEVELRYAYSVPPPPSVSDTPASAFVILLSDVPLSPDARASRAELLQTILRGQARVATLELNEGGSVRTFRIDLLRESRVVSVEHPVGVTVSADRIDALRAAARVRVNRAAAGPLPAFRADVSFAVAVAPPTSDAEMAERLGSAPVKAAEAYVAAIRAGDLASYLDLLADPALGSARLMEHWRAEWPANARPIDAVTLSSGSVLVEFEGGAGRVFYAFTLKLVQVGGAWKVIE